MMKSQIAEDIRKTKSIFRSSVYFVLHPDENRMWLSRMRLNEADLVILKHV